MKLINLTLIITLLSGCATGQDHRFVKKGATRQQWYRDINDCRYKANSINPAYGQRYYDVMDEKTRFVAECLLAKGWILED